jgi:hypothetical protein
MSEAEQPARENRGWRGRSEDLKGGGGLKASEADQGIPEDVLHPGGHAPQIGEESTI